jgi:hypothetical protein
MSSYSYSRYVGQAVQFVGDVFICVGGTRNGLTHSAVLLPLLLNRASLCHHIVIELFIAYQVYPLNYRTDFIEI